MQPQVYGQPKDFYSPRPLIFSSHTSPKELVLSVGYDGGVDMNVSFSLPHSLFVFAQGGVNTFSHSRNESLEPRYTINKNDYSWLAGVGLYAELKYSFFNIVELQAGAGTTSIDNFRRSSTSTTEVYNRHTLANYGTVFCQMNAVKMIKSSELGIAGRLSYSQYNHLEHFIGSGAITNRNTNSFGFLSIEPALSYSLLVRNFKGNLQFGISVPLHSDDTYIEESQHNTITLENYSDFYFFWRISIQYARFTYTGQGRR